MDDARIWTGFWPKGLRRVVNFSIASPIVLIPPMARRVQRYEKAMRERLRLLREGCADAAWLAALEDEMAQTRRGHRSSAGGI